MRRRPCRPAPGGRAAGHGWRRGCRRRRTAATTSSGTQADEPDGDVEHPLHPAVARAVELADVEQQRHPLELGHRQLAEPLLVEQRERADPDALLVERGGLGDDRLVVLGLARSSTTTVGRTVVGRSRAAGARRSWRLAAATGSKPTTMGRALRRVARARRRAGAGSPRSATTSTRSRLRPRPRLRGEPAQASAHGHEEARPSRTRRTGAAGHRRRAAGRPRCRRPPHAGADQRSSHGLRGRRGRSGRPTP